MQFGFLLLTFIATQAPAVQSEPGDGVKWYSLEKQRGSVVHSNSKTLTQIREHCPARFGNQYESQDQITAGHEITHGINSEVRRRAGRGRCAFYLPPDRVAVIDSPRLTLRDVASRVPAGCRGGRYQTYLVSQLRDWNDTPLYVLDEWSAYINGCLVGMEAPHGGGNSDDMVSPLEFTYYALALCLAAEQLDPKFVADNVQFREYIAFNIRYSAWIWEAGSRIPGFRWSGQIRQNFINSPDAKPLRELAVRWYGSTFAAKYLGVTN